MAQTSKTKKKYRCAKCEHKFSKADYFEFAKIRTVECPLCGAPTPHIRQGKDWVSIG